MKRVLAAAVALAGLGLFPVSTSGSPLGADEVCFPGNPFSNVQPRPKDGHVLITRLAANTPVLRINVTDACGKDIAGAIGWPKDLRGEPGLPFHPGTGLTLFNFSFDVPRRVQKEGTGVPGTPPQFFDVADYRNEEVVPPGRRVGLNVESIFRDDATGLLTIGSVFGTIAATVGVGRKVLVPEFAADTNGDGLFGAGDTLFTLVDLPLFLPALPSFGFGEVFAALDGGVPGFPGMRVSTTPFVFDSVTGFTGTPFSGEVFVVGRHGLTAVPEPSSLAFLGSLLAGLLACSRWRWKRLPSG